MYRQRLNKDNAKVYKDGYSLIIMSRYREIKKYAGMYVIKLLPADMKDLNLKIGDFVDIQEAVFKTSISKENKKRLNIK